MGSLTAKEKESSNLPVMFELKVLVIHLVIFKYLITFFCILLADKGSDRFAIRYVFGPKGASKAEIILVKPVDYEKENLYSLTVLAIVCITLTYKEILL